MRTGLGGIVAIIPARGGSKGIPRKNVALVAGTPLLAYTIEHALGTPEIERIIVSTDDAEIGAIARASGAEVVWRPAELSGDTATSEAALSHALDELRAGNGYEPELVVFAQATSPLRQPHDLSNGIETLRRADADSLFSACALHGFVWRKERSHLASFSYDYRRRPRRQDGPEDLVENGSFYVFKPWVLRHLHNRLGGVITEYRMSLLDSVQVDEPGDLALVERLLNGRLPAPSARELAAIRLLVLDFDGVLTDNRVLVDQDGREAVWCDRGDGWGIARLRETELDVVVLTTEQVRIATARCRKLGIECVQACEDKLAALQGMSHARQLGPVEIAYVGNDVNDLACLQWVGLPIAVSDAMPEVRAVARWVTTRPGGHGAVREVAEALLRVRE